ncbi:MAG: urease accessory protein UreD [Pseudomonadota bacterium]
MGGRQKSVVDRLYQEGAARIRLPKTHADHLEAVLINTAGGLTGGDRFTWDLAAGAGTNVTATTQACEKIYKAATDAAGPLRSTAAKLETHIEVGEDATFSYLPQETILFDRSSLDRTLTARLAAQSRIFVLEAVMLGREAMGETVSSCHFTDNWRIFRNNRLIHADATRLEDSRLGNTDANSLLDGRSAFASLVYCGPEDRDQLEAVVSRLRQNVGVESLGMSAMDNKIVARCLAKNAYEMRRDLIPFIEASRRLLGIGGDLPKVWRL